MATHSNPLSKPLVDLVEIVERQFGVGLPPGARRGSWYPSELPAAVRAARHALALRESGNICAETVPNR